MPYKDPRDPRRLATQARYNVSPRGRDRTARYEASTKGILKSEIRYQRRERGEPSVRED